MKRFTERQKDTYAVAEESIIHEENSYTGEAVNRLAQFENIFENLVKSQELTLSELEKLRAADKTKPVHFRELLTKKLTNSQMLLLFKSGGIE